MPDTPLSIEEILTLLAKGPDHIAGLTEGLTSAQLLASPEPGEWSARDVLAHLQSCSDVWGKCIQMILTEDKPTIRAVNPRTWIEQTGYGEMEFHPLLQAYSIQRAALMAVIQPLAPEDWFRSALVTGAGTPLEKSVYDYAYRLARHERVHLKQIEGIAFLVDS